MDLEKFNQWVIDEFEFYCFENSFFENALYSAAEEFKSSKFNGLPFEEIYRDVLFEKFLCRYKSRLKLLLKHIPSPTSNVQLNVLGIDLNSYYDRREYLLQQISRLECQCEGE